MKFIVKLSPDGALSTVQVNEKDELKTLQESVGGYIEVVPGIIEMMGNRYRAIVNEDGIMQNLHYNLKASRIIGEHLFGNVTFVKYGDDLEPLTMDEAVRLMVNISNYFVGKEVV